MDFITKQMHGVEVNFRNNDGYLNCSALSKAYEAKTGTRRDPYDWLRLARTKESILHLSTVTGIAETDLVHILQGGNDQKNQGTYIHPKLALRFAIWLSDEFGYAVECWFDDWRKGQTQPEVQEMSELEMLRTIIDKAIENERLQKALEATQKLQNQKMNFLETKIERQDSINKEVDAELDRIENCHGRYFTVMGYAAYHGIQNLTIAQASGKGRRASNLCKKLGLPTGRCKDPRFGEVNSYPESVLDQIFN